MHTTSSRHCCKRETESSHRKGCHLSRSYMCKTDACCSEIRCAPTIFLCPHFHAVIILVSAYDGGDCCACTCTSGPKYPCTSSNFACVDPGASCLEDTDEGNLINTECVPDIMSDGGCDLSNNNEECGALRAWITRECTVTPVQSA